MNLSNDRDILDGIQQLFNGGYFDIIICVWISLPLKHNREFSNGSDIISLVFGIFSLLIVIIHPFWMLFRIVKNWKILNKQETRDLYGMYYPDVSVKHLP